MKKLIVTMLVLLLIVALAGCGADPKPSQAPNDPVAEEPSQAPNDEPIRVLYIPGDLNNEFFVYVVNGVKMKGEELGVEVSIQGSTSSVADEEQVGFIENALASGIDGIILTCASSDGVATGVKKAQEQGVPLLCVDSGVIPETVERFNLETVPYVGTDNVEAGRMVGRWVMENFPEGTKAIILEGTVGHSCNIDRMQGLFEAMDETYLDIVGQQNADWAMEPAYEATQNILAAQPDVELVIALNDGMGIGAQNAIKEAGLSVPIIGVNGDAEGLKQISAGTDFKATVAQNPGLMGETSLELLYKWIVDGEKPADVTSTDCMTATPDSVEEYKENVSKYY